MDWKRVNALKAEFDALREQWNKTNDDDERRTIADKMCALLREAQEIRDRLRNERDASSK